MISSLALAAAGLLLALQGFRFARILIALTAAGAGILAGALGAQIGHVPVAGPAALGALLFGGIALLRYRIGLGIASALMFGLVLDFLAVQLAITTPGSSVPFACGAVVGAAMLGLLGRTLPIIVTTLEGSVLLLIGFVGLCSALLPSLGNTFVATADRIALMVPTLLLMLFITGYSVQFNARQGDVRVGGGRGWNDGQ